MSKGALRPSLPPSVPLPRTSRSHSHALAEYPLQRCISNLPVAIRLDGFLKTAQVEIGPKGRGEDGIGGALGKGAGDGGSRRGGGGRGCPGGGGVAKDALVLRLGLDEDHVRVRVGRGAGGDGSARADRGLARARLPGRRGLRGPLRRRLVPVAPVVLLVARDLGQRGLGLGARALAAAWRAGGGGGPGGRRGARRQGEAVGDVAARRVRLAQLVGVLFDAAELELDPVRCRLAKVLGYICRSGLAPVWTWGGGRARGKGREKGRRGSVEGAYSSCRLRPGPWACCLRRRGASCRSPGGVLRG